MRIFTIIYGVLQHYYDERCSPEIWSSLLTSLLAKNNRGECAFSPSKNTINARFKKEKLKKLAKCLVVSSHVATLKNEAKHEYITCKRLFDCFVKQLKEPLFNNICMFSFVLKKFLIHQWHKCIRKLLCLWKLASCFKLKWKNVWKEKDHQPTKQKITQLQKRHSLNLRNFARGLSLVWQSLGTPVIRDMTKWAW